MQGVLLGSYNHSNQTLQEALLVFSNNEGSGKMYRIGIDAGSKTLKLIMLDEDGKEVSKTYIRHRANIARTLEEVIHKLNWRMGPFEATVAMTGSGAIDIARELNIPFVQEVVATTYAVRKSVPQADAVIELGGEDAKVIYLTGGLEQRMNATCAGGTGGFIDTIAYMLDVGSPRMSDLAYGHTNIYPIASRCAVFAQTDVRPLLSEGASKSDIAASAFEAVVRQTLSGLACGRPIKGNVVFLGGPLEHMPYLVNSFRNALGLDESQGIKPEDAHLFTVRGAALLSNDEERLGCAPVRINSAELLERIEKIELLENNLDFLLALFDDEVELNSFRQSRAAVSFPEERSGRARGPLYVGIDAGSTTLKIAVINDEGKLVYDSYEPIHGELIKTLRKGLLSMYRSVIPPSYLANPDDAAWIAQVAATGYGESLLCRAFGVDTGAVETAAHLRSARELCPDLNLLLDIGGQDMKALWVKDGMVVDAALNEACSSGCGAFIEGTAAALKTTAQNFASDALVAKHPIDLGTKCTVFMSSRVKHAQKMGAPIEDIAAGVAYSVVRNALHRIIGDDRVPRAGDKVVVQGGTFESDAVLRAFERVTGIEAIRPAQSRIMGAIGCALIARDRAQKLSADTDESQRVTSSLISCADLDDLRMDRERLTCTGCNNACKLTVLSFDEKKSRYFISDNKCERGLDELKRRAMSADPSNDGPLVTQMSSSEGVEPIHEQAPNLIALEQRMLNAFSDVEQQGHRGDICIGLLDSMALHAYRPFWHTLFTQLGFSVKLPEAGCEDDRMSEAWETIPSESACYPAKTSHVRYFSLCGKGCDGVFFPSFTRGFHCPVQTGYAKTLASNVRSTRTKEALVPFVSPQLASYKPERLIDDDRSVKSLLDSLNELIAEQGDVGGKPSQPILLISAEELDDALQAALQKQNKIMRRFEDAMRSALDWLDEDPSRHGIVLAGRPYHADEALLHDIDQELSRLGFAVLGAAGITDAILRAGSNRIDGAYPFIPAKRMVGLARFAAQNPQLDAVFLESFGCGFDAMSLVEAGEVLDEAHKPCTVLKIDDIVDTAHIRIRLRTLAAAIELREGRDSTIVLEPDDESGSEASQNAARARKGDAYSLLASMRDNPLNADDLECSRRACAKDVCFTANAMAARVIRALEDDPSISKVELPNTCENCMTQAIPRIVEHACGRTPEFSWAPWAGTTDALQAEKEEKGELAKRRPRIAIIGNPLLCFDAFMNEHIVEALEGLGCECVLPDPGLVVGEDVRYIEQLELFEEEGIHDVIYLLSFGCLKGHIQARGALRELQERFPDMRITVIDYDPESSALNRENRIRLAVENAREATLAMTC